MYFDKEDAIKLAKNARNAIADLVNYRTLSSDYDEKECITINILDLEYSLEKLDKAIEDSPTQVRDESGKLV